jgi:6-oxo-cyclohex-1-ene-carbonyl-CoA hydrolase
MISKLMAFDAEMIGTWGCKPEYYNNVLATGAGAAEGADPALPGDQAHEQHREKVFEQQHAGTVRQTPSAGARFLATKQCWKGRVKKRPQKSKIRKRAQPVFLGILWESSSFQTHIGRITHKCLEENMALEWMPREHELKNHLLFEEDMVQGRYWGTDDDAPCVVYTKKPLVNPFTGEEVPDLYVAEVRLNNPRQYNSYTTTMVKGVIAGFRAASGDRSVVATVFTGTGFDAFCTGGNTKEYRILLPRPNEYGEYMDLFNEMVDSILMCKKPTICRVNGMRVAGGQEIGMACDLAITSDLAIFGQAGARHGSAPDGGSTDFLPWMLNMEDAMWNCVSCEMWSAYKMKAKNLVSKVVPVLKDGDKWVRNPMIITDKYVEDGEIVYGEYLKDKGAVEAKPRPMIKELPKDSGAAGQRSEQDHLDLRQPVPRLRDEVHRRHPRQEEILLGPGQAAQPALAHGQHELRGLPGLRRLQHQEDHRHRRHRLHKVPPTGRPRRQRFHDELYAQVLGSPKRSKRKKIKRVRGKAPFPP